MDWRKIVRDVQAKYRIKVMGHHDVQEVFELYTILETIHIDGTQKLTPELLVCKHALEVGIGGLLKSAVEPIHLDALIRNSLIIAYNLGKGANHEAEVMEGDSSSE